MLHNLLIPLQDTLKKELGLNYINRRNIALYMSVKKE
jgi:hypothetical protein